MGLSPEQLAFYEENGYVVVEDIVSPDVLERLRTAISEATEAAQAGRDARYKPAAEDDAGGGVRTVAPLRKLNELVPNDPFFRAVASSDRILDIVAQLAHADQGIMLYSDQVFLKPAFCGSEKPLHQDNSYFRVTPQDFGVTCWMAVDDATVENGCMNYIPGSHKLGLVPHRAVTDVHLTPEGDGFGEEVPVPVRAGTAIFHHLLCLHGSKANRSDKSRRAWALHYANAQAQTPVRPREKLIPMR
jgi:ectoine hydroxylase-related dioxygenase (phytanoyl-CoA dioxygenase family)